MMREWYVFVCELMLSCLVLIDKGERVEESTGWLRTL